MPGSSVTARNSDSARVVQFPVMGKRGFGHLYLRGKIWWAKWYRDGRPHQKSTGKTNKTEATNWLKEQIGAKAEPVRGKRVLVKELLDDALEFYRVHRPRSYDDFGRSTVKALKAKLGLYRTDRVTTAVLEQYKKDRLAEGKANATVNRELAMLRIAFRRAAKSTPPKVSTVPVFQLLPEAAPRKGFLEPEQYERLLKELPDDLKALFVLGYHFGCRRSELLAMRWSQVDFSAGVIILWVGETKNDEGRVLPMFGDVKSTLLKQRALDQETDLVFHRHGASISDFRGSWEAACKRAEVPDLLFHDLRRSAVRNMVRSGIPERVAMKISGHRTRAVFDRYNVVDERDLAEAAKKISRYVKRRKAS